MYYYRNLEFKLRHLKNLKLFSTGVKELFDLIVLRKQNKTKQTHTHTHTHKQTNKQKTADGLLLFLKAFS